MFCCIHDPGMALFLSESPVGTEPEAGPLEWIAFGATLLLAVIALSVPA